MCLRSITYIVVTRTVDPSFAVVIYYASFAMHYAIKISKLSKKIKKLLLLTIDDDYDEKHEHLNQSYIKEIMIT